MNLLTKNISSLEKVLKWEDTEKINSCDNAMLLLGESFSYQVCAFNPEAPKNAFYWLTLKVYVESPLKDYVNLYFVNNVIADNIIPRDNDCLITEPGVLPDLLLPVEKQNGKAFYNCLLRTIWVEVNVPKDFESGKYPIDIVFESIKTGEKHICRFEADVKDSVLPTQSTEYTDWLHTDCIADVHGVPVYSEEHWTLIEKYMSMAQKMGVNLLYTPIITPSLDTFDGGKRTYCQLLKANKCGDAFIFDFSLVDRWIDTAHKCGIYKFEFSHLFSQGGARTTPYIMVTVDGKACEYFTLSMSARSDEYRIFLTQMLTELIEYLKNKGVYDNCYFHLSDEPTEAHLENYTYAKEIVAPIVGENKIMDALSAYDYYEKGIVKIPVVDIESIDVFLQNKTPNLWGYYCNSCYDKFPNRFIHYPSYRNRIIGLLIYKYNLAGFLHWGFNFYNSGMSLWHQSPYLSTSGGIGYPAGDPYCVYPYMDDVVPSLRAVIFKEALQDVDVCKALEKKIGREEVIKLIDDMAGINITFTEYPRNSEYVPSVMQKIKSLL